MNSTSTRHRWPKLGDPQEQRFARKTERECLRGCGTIKITLHPEGRDGRVHTIEFWRDGEKIEGAGTPICEPVEQEVEHGRA